MRATLSFILCSALLYSIAFAQKGQETTTAPEPTKPNQVKQEEPVKAVAEKPAPPATQTKAEKTEQTIADKTESSVQQAPPAQEKKEPPAASTPQQKPAEIVQQTKEDQQSATAQKSAPEQKNPSQKPDQTPPVPTRQAATAPAPASAQPQPVKAPAPDAKQTVAAKAPAAAPAAQNTIKQNTSGMSISRASIALSIKDLEPESTGDTFPPEVNRLYCFSHVKNAPESAEIEHRWYWNDDLIGSIPLAVKSVNFRTYSAKTIPAGMVGDWRVAIVNTKNEDVLKMLHFTIK